MRKVFLAAVVIATTLLGLAVPAVAAAESDARIVIIVGADTPQYLDDADQLYAEAIRHTANVIRVYSPNATWAAVKAATTGANVVIYLGHGNGWPSPYTYDPNYTTKDGFGLNATAAGTHSNLKYYGEPSIRTLQLAPGAIVFFHHLCYASGNSEPGAAGPTLSVARQRVDNYGAAFLAAGASAVIADGHSHTGYYLRALFTQTETLGQLWRGAPNYHGHETAFTPTRSPGRGVMDPDVGGASPSGYYRSIVGDLSFATSDVIGLKLPPHTIGTTGGVTVDRSSGTTDTTGTEPRALGWPAPTLITRAPRLTVLRIAASPR
ncbi:MAG: hypothetical protein ACJ765_12180 [Chloroflexota bacterium]